MTLRANRKSLYPDKCVFGVTRGKCLGFFVDEGGIEANPDKIHVVLNMKSTSSVKEVKRLTGCIAALSHFMSKSADRCYAFFRVLKQATFKWGPEAEEAFHHLKKYL